MDNIALNLVSSILHIAINEPNIEDIHSMVDQLASGRLHYRYPNPTPTHGATPAVEASSCLDNRTHRDENCATAPSTTQTDMMKGSDPRDDANDPLAHENPVKSRGMFQRLIQKNGSLFDAPLDSTTPTNNDKPRTDNIPAPNFGIQRALRSAHHTTQVRTAKLPKHILTMYP